MIRRSAVVMKWRVLIVRTAPKVQSDSPASGSLSDPRRPAAAHALLSARSVGARSKEAVVS